MKKGALFIDHTTVSAQVTEKLYKKSQELGIRFIDAPISGGQAGAENGVLSIMCGGDEEIINWLSQCWRYILRFVVELETPALGRKQKCAIK